MIVGEVALHDLHRTVSYLGSGDQLHLAHNFAFLRLPWDAEAFRASIDDFERARRRRRLAGLVSLQPRPFARARRASAPGARPRPSR